LLKSHVGLKIKIADGKFTYSGIGYLANNVPNGDYEIKTVAEEVNGDVTLSSGKSLKNPLKLCPTKFSWIDHNDYAEDVWRPLKAIDASQSTDWSNWYARRAIDGDPEVCSLTKADAGGWLRIDLGKHYEIRSVKIRDRALQAQLTRLQTVTKGSMNEEDSRLGVVMSTFVEFLTGTKVSVEDSNQNYATTGKCGGKQGLPSSKSEWGSEVRCLAEDGQSGRPIGDTIFLERSDQLGVCEVEVWARPVESPPPADCEYVFSQAGEKVVFKDGKVKVKGIFRTVQYEGEPHADGEVEIKNVELPNEATRTAESGLRESRQVKSALGPKVHLEDGTSFYNPAGNTKITGGWIFTKSSSVESEFTYTVGVATSKGTTTSQAWSSSVEDSVTAGVSVEVGTCAGVGTGSCAEEQLLAWATGTVSYSAGASVEASHTSVRSQESAEEVSNTLDQSTEKSMTYTLPPGAMWQWEYKVEDECTGARRSSPVMIKVNHVVATSSVAEPPCCMPGHFADPTKPHGACVMIGDKKDEKSPCLRGCDDSTCFPTAEKGPCDDILKALKEIGASQADYRTTLLTKVIEHCPTLTGKDLAEKLGISADAEVALQFDELRSGSN
jgi:hypothetical protein